MTSNFSTAMRRAMDLTRAADVMGATRAIQDALSFGKPAPVNAADGVESLEAFPLPPLDAEIENTPVAPIARSDVSAAAPRAQKPLSEVIGILRKGRAKLLDVPAARTPTIKTPQGAQFLSRVSTAEAGARRYKLYVPAPRRQAPRGLIVMLHGCQQNADDFAVGTGMNVVAEHHNFIVAYPQQETSANAAACWNWFMPAHQLRDRGEPASIVAITRALIAEFKVPPSQVFVAGLSAGGAMAAVLAETYPDLYAAAGIHSGLAYGSASDVMSAFSAMRGDKRSPRVARSNSASAPARLIIFQGSADSTVHPSNAQHLVNGAATADWKSIEPPPSNHNGRSVARQIFEDAHGSSRLEVWRIEGAGHAWSGGDSSGSFTDTKGPNASEEMLRFFRGEVG